MGMTLSFDSTTIVGMQPEEPSEASGARCMRDLMFLTRCKDSALRLEGVGDFSRLCGRETSWKTKNEREINKHQPFEMNIENKPSVHISTVTPTKQTKGAPTPQLVSHLLEAFSPTTLAPHHVSFVGEMEEWGKGA
jgi:hypothetical protein